MKKGSPKKVCCPRCHRYFCDVDFSEYPSITARHIKIVAGQRRKIKNGQSLKCSFCSYELTTWDIVIAGASPNVTDSLKPGQEAVL